MADLERITESKPNETLPTLYKARLPRFLSYPLGAQKISEALVEVREFAPIGIWFTNNAKRDHGTQRPYEVLEGSYTRESNTVSESRMSIEQGWNRPKWSVTVQAVPRELKHEIQVILLNHALPRLKAWFIASRALFGRKDNTRSASNTMRDYRCYSSRSRLAPNGIR
jgi:hypothetical protein